MQEDKNRGTVLQEADFALGERLTSIRLRAGFTQSDLATKVGVSRQHISNIETMTTSPTVRVLRDYLRACGTDLAEFFYGPLPIEQTPQQREYHRKLQALLEHSTTHSAITKVLDSFMTSLEISAKALVQPVRVLKRTARISRVPGAKKDKGGE